MLRHIIHTQSRVVDMLVGLGVCLDLVGFMFVAADSVWLEIGVKCWRGLSVVGVQRLQHYVVASLALAPDLKCSRNPRSSNSPPARRFP